MLTINQVYNMLTTEVAVAMSQRNVTINDIRDKPSWDDRNWYDRYGTVTLKEGEDPTVLGDLVLAPWDWLATLPTQVPAAIVNRAKDLQVEIDAFVRSQDAHGQGLFLSKAARWVTAIANNLPQ